MARRVAPHPDDVRTSLGEAGARRAQAERDRAEAMHDIGRLLPTAVAAGISVVEIASLTGLSRQTIHAGLVK